MSQTTTIVSERVANDLARRIEGREMAIGTYLPPTRELAAHYGVSLHAVGVALKRLERMNLVECRPRQGAVVRSHTASADQAQPQVRQVLLFVNNLADWLAEESAWGSWEHQIIRHFEMELFSAGYSLMVLPANSSDPMRPTLAQRMDRLGDTLQGAILFCFPGVAEVIEQLEARQLPWVSINRPSRAIRHNYVAADSQEAGWRAGRLCLAGRFERVLILCQPSTHVTTSSEKVAGFMQSYAEAGVSVDQVRVAYCPGYEQADGLAVTAGVLAEGWRPQAVFAVGDLLAAGAMQALAEAGLRVPDDVSVIGSTGLAGSAALSPALTVVAQPMEAIGQNAAQMLLAMMREGVRRLAPRRLACPLVWRDSVRLADTAIAALSRDPETAWFAQGTQG